MSLRCGCYDQADDIVFGAHHRCSQERDHCGCGFPFGARTCPVHGTPEPEGVAAADLQRDLNRLEGRLYDHDLQEARIHQTLAPDELVD